MNKCLESAKELLEANNYTCVIQNQESVYTSTQRGVAPLLDWLKAGKDFTGYVAADKVVGKAAAFLYVLLKVDCVYAAVVSVPAIDVLEKYGIQVSFTYKTDAIRNRTNTGFCPMETAVWDITEPKEALDAICQKRQELRALS